LSLTKKHSVILDETVDPDPSAMTEALRAFGYDLSTAIADVIDNSISAKARRIDVHFFWAGCSSWIRVSDDGHGMDAHELKSAMRLGSRHPREERDPRDLGRFGLGLKTASFSQCRRLTVLSRKLNSETAIRCWDLDHVEQQKRWALIKGVHPATAPETLANLVEPLGDGSGTAVLWEQLDRVIGDAEVDDERAMRHFYDKADDVGRHLAMVFHRFMGSHGKIAISVNGRGLTAWDPFLEDNPASQKFDEEYFLVNGVPVTITPHVLPHQSKMTLGEHVNAAGPKGWNAQQGFYIYRNRRLLVSGDWLRMFRQEEHYKLARIMIDIPNSLDEEWNIDVRKAQARPPDSLREDLKRIADRTRALAVAVYRHRGAVLRPPRSDKAAVVWEQVRRHGKVAYKLNQNHPIYRAVTGRDPQGQDVKAFLRLLEETLPIALIIASFGDSEESQETPFVGQHAELRNLLEVMVRSLLKQGIDRNDIRQRLPAMEPFNHYPDFLELALNEVLESSNE
jgi:Histidine kinase-, DNA gyrase B-, and HSP90-like ATPase